jgi:carbamoyl-phosphate synthase large subunit
LPQNSYDMPVLVTGAGGPAGVAVIRALRACGRGVVGVDADPMAAGIRLADEGMVVPRYGDSEYVEALCSIAVKTGAGILVSTLAEEMPVLAERASELDASGLAHWLPPKDAVQTCIDKWRFATLAQQSGAPVPATALATADGVPGPWVVKPRFGRGSRDVHLVDDDEGLRWALSHVDDPIVQTRLVGREFTIDALVDRNGAWAGAVPRWRLETKAGISVKGETFADRALDRAAADLLSAIGLVGPANIQGFVNSAGHVAFVEVNPRFSGALPLSLAAGSDLVGEYVRAVVGLPVRPERLRHRAGVRMVRYYEEIFEG